MIAEFFVSIFSTFERPLSLIADYCRSWPVSPAISEVPVGLDAAELGSRG